MSKFTEWLEGEGAKIFTMSALCLVFFAAEVAIKVWVPESEQLQGQIGSIAAGFGGALLAILRPPPSAMAK